MTLIVAIDPIMYKLSNHISAAKLLLVLKLKPKTDKITQWSSKLFMIERHPELRPFYDTRNFEDVSEMLMTAREEADVNALYLHVKDLKSVVVAHQKDFKSFSTPGFC